MFRLSWIFAFFLLFFEGLVPFTEAETLAYKYNVTTRHATLDKRYHVEWFVNKSSEEIYFNVHAKTTGYVGFGISNTGEMKGADIVIGGRFSFPTFYFRDRFGVGNAEPVIDDHQDWTLLESQEKDGVTSLTFKRPLKTCDEYDVEIKNQTQYFIWAMGPEDTIDYHGTRHRGNFPVNILDPPAPVEDLTKQGKNSHKSIKITTEVFIGSEKTTHWCSVRRSREFMRRANPQIIAMTPNLNTPSSLRHTHHLNLYLCKAPIGRNAGNYFYQFEDGNCFSSSDREEELSESNNSSYSSTVRKYPAFKDCHSLIYSWTIGGKTLYLPPNIALPLSDRRDRHREYFLLELHLDNPSARRNFSFTAGVELFYTETPREKEAGILRIQSGKGWEITIPPNTPAFTVNSHCSPDCSSLMPVGLNFFNLQFHSHNLARKMRLRHFRGKKELPYIADDENYNSHFQDNRNLVPVSFLPGDQLVLECTFSSQHLNPSRAIIGGISTNQEMCEATLFYWPKGLLTGCGSTPNLTLIQEVLNVTVNFENEQTPTVYLQSSNIPITYEEFLNSHVKWNSSLVSRLQEIQAFLPQTTICSIDQDSDLFGPSSTLNKSTLLAGKAAVSFPKKYEPYHPNSKKVCALPTTPNTERTTDLMTVTTEEGSLVTIEFTPTMRETDTRAPIVVKDSTGEKSNSSSRGGRLLQEIVFIRFCFCSILLVNFVL